PIVSNRDVMRALEPHGLAYPIGHCPEVKMSGYLLSGGMSWNHGEFGPGCGSVEAFDAVLADGTLVHASASNEHADLFWCLGAGSFFPAVVVRFHLRLAPLRVLASSSLSFSMRDVVDVARWVEQLAATLTSNVEL